MIIILEYSDSLHYSFDGDGDLMGRTACGFKMGSRVLAEWMSDDEAIDKGITITCKNCRMAIERKIK